MKVFRLNDYEWWAAETMEQAIEACMAECGVEREEAFDESIAHELSAGEMDKLIYQDEDGTERCFREQLALMSPKRPCLFASTEF